MNSNQTEIALSDVSANESIQTLKNIFKSYLIVFAALVILLIIFFAGGNLFIEDGLHQIWKNKITDFFVLFISKYPNPFFKENKV